MEAWLLRSIPKFKNVGKKALVATAQIVGVFIYLLTLFLPVALTDNESIWAVWVGLMLVGSFYGAILYSIAKEKDKAFPLLLRLRLSLRQATRNFFIGIAIFSGLIVFGAVLDGDESPSTPSYTSENTGDPSSLPPLPSLPSLRPTYTTPAPVYYDSSYKYNYRGGYSGSYDYNYDVEGYSDSGDYFYGNVDTSGKYGDGYIYDDYGNEVYVDTEWVDYGVMEATDEYGNTYEFEVQ